MEIFERRINGTDVRFAIANSHDWIQKYHYDGKFYEQHILDHIKPYLAPDRSFIDIGANVGNHSLYVSLFCDVFRVIPFEANPEALEIMRATLAANNCHNVVTDHLGVALGDHGGFARLRKTTHNNLGGTQFDYVDDGDIRCIRGDSVLLAEPVGFIKIDVETTEYEVLDGLEKTIGKWRPVMMVETVTEWNQRLAAWCDQHSYRIEKTMGWDNLLIPNERETA